MYTYLFVYFLQITRLAIWLTRYEMRKMKLGNISIPRSLEIRSMVSKMEEKIYSASLSVWFQSVFRTDKGWIVAWCGRCLQNFHCVKHFRNKNKAEKLRGIKLVNSKNIQTWTEEKHSRVSIPTMLKSARLETLSLFLTCHSLGNELIVYVEEGGRLFPLGFN